MRILGWIAFLLLIGATCAMAGAYAFQTGYSHGETWAWVFAAAVAALVVAECVIAADRASAGLAKWAPLIVIMAAIASLETGFAASMFTDARAIRAAAETEAARPVPLEPAAAIRARLEAHEGRHPGIKATWCGSKSTDARTACETWTELRADLAAATAAERRGVARPAGDADARAALLTRLFGGNAARWADALTVLLSFALSLGRVRLAALLAGPTVAAIVRPATRGAVARVDVAEVRPVPAEPAAPVAEVQPEPARQVAAAAPANLPEPAGRVLRIVAELATPPADGQGFVGFIPPGVLSQRSLADRAALSRRHVADGLEALQSAGLLRIETHGRDGTAYTLLKAAD